MAEMDIIDVDAFEPEPDDGIEYFGFDTAPHLPFLKYQTPNPHGPGMITVIPADHMRATKVIYNLVDRDDDDDRPQKTARRTNCAQPVAGPSRPNSSSNEVGPSRRLKGNSSDSDEVVELLVPNKIGPPKRRKKSKTKSAKKQAIVIEDSDDEASHVIRTTEGLPDADAQDVDVIMHSHHSEEEDEDEEDYDTIHAGFDLNELSAWTQIELAKNYEMFEDERDAEMEISLTAAALSQETQTILMQRIKNNMRFCRRKHAPPYRPLPGPRSHHDDDYTTWEAMQRMGGNTLLPFCRKSIDSPLRMKFQHGLLSRFKNLQTKTLTHFSPGPIVSISQSNEMTAVASCVLWHIDSNEDADRIYNRDASVKLLYGDHVVRFQGHSTTTSQGITRYHTVNAAQFDPAEEYRLVSCATDGQVIISDCTDVIHGEPPKITRQYSLGPGRTPSGVSFRPDGAVFTVWDSLGHIRIDKGREQRFFDCRVCQPDECQPVQAVTWGKEQSKDILFASTASEVWNNYTGFHKAFDVETGKRLCSFDDYGAGECSDVDPRGMELALATCTEGQRFKLSMYDIRSRRSTRSVDLDKLPRWYQETDDNRTNPLINKVPSMINQVSYSSDGVYIALARSDNSVHIYDSRFLDRRLYNFKHERPSEGTLDDEKYGVYQIQWMDCPNTGRTGLISAGADGCVRLWDITEGRVSWSQPENGAILAQAESYASWFSLGDPSKGEKPLVLGDGGGSIVIRDLYEF